MLCRWLREWGMMMRTRRLLVLLAVTAVWAVQAIPALAADTGDLEDAGREAEVVPGEFAASIPGIYPVAELVTGSSQGLRGPVLDPATGFLWMSDRTNDKIVVYDHAGELQFEFGVAGTGSGQFGLPQGIAFHGNEVFIADEQNDRVEVFDKQGNYLRNWGSTGNLSGQFNEPCDVEIANNLVYVTDANNDRIQVFTPAGSYVNQFGSTGAGNGQLTLDCSGASLTHYNGEIFVTDETNSRVVVFDLDGNWERNFGSSATLDEPGGIDADEQGRIWVADYLTNEITVWSPIGAPLGTVGGPGATLGTFTGLRGLVVDPSGDSVWVQDSNNDRVQVLTTKRCDGGLLTHVGTSYADKFTTGPEDDVVHLGAGQDEVATKFGKDTICGGKGSDLIRAGHGKDKVLGDKGNDTIFGGKARDVLIGGHGNDTFYGGRGDDTIKGKAGRDNASGGNGDDTLLGGAKGDKLKGNDGDDTLRGGSGNDICKGGAGSDTAKGCETKMGIDLISDQPVAVLPQQVEVG